MEYVTKTFNMTLRVTGIVNLHFFEFDNDFSTEGERHPFYELVFVNSGSLHISSEDYSGELLRNHMLIHRQNTVHSLSCGSEEPTVIIIGFTCDSTLIDRFSKEPLKLSDTSVKQLAEIVKEGRNVFKPPYNIPVYDMKKKKRQPIGSDQMLQILIEYFLIRLLREHGGSDTDETLSTSPMPMIQELIRYVSDNYREKITLDELAFLFNTNRATLCREFKEATGTTVIGFINEKKLESAKKKMLETNDTFTSIAENLNFESIHYFTRFFKKMTGMTPKEFRKKYKEN